VATNKFATKDQCTNLTVTALKAWLSVFHGNISGFIDDKVDTILTYVVGNVLEKKMIPLGA
jgi:hypothetical protein